LAAGVEGADSWATDDDMEISFRSIVAAAQRRKS
jgi:hypothetical protein